MDLIFRKKYKGYQGTCQCSKEDKCFYGKVISDKHLISYEAESVAALYKAFQEAVDDFLETLKELEE